MIQFTDDFMLNIRVIDEQHRELIRLTNNLIQEHDNGNFSNMDKHFNELVEYTKYHFNSEEAFFNLYKSPYLNKHKKLHAGFVNKLHALYESYLSSPHPEKTQHELCQYLENWIKHHIVIEDMKMKETMEKR